MEVGKRLKSAISMLVMIQGPGHGTRRWVCRLGRLATKRNRRDYIQFEVNLSPLILAPGAHRLTLTEAVDVETNSLLVYLPSRKTDSQD